MSVDLVFALLEFLLLVVLVLIIGNGTIDDEKEDDLMAGAPCCVCMEGDHAVRTGPVNRTPAHCDCFQSVRPAASPPGTGRRTLVAGGTRVDPRTASSSNNPPGTTPIC